MICTESLVLSVCFFYLTDPMLFDRQFWATSESVCSLSFFLLLLDTLLYCKTNRIFTARLVSYMIDVLIVSLGIWCNNK